MNNIASLSLTPKKGCYLNAGTLASSRAARMQYVSGTNGILSSYLFFISVKFLLSSGCDFYVFTKNFYLRIISIIISFKIT
jgi:hypothetical protein